MVTTLCDTGAGFWMKPGRTYKGFIITAFAAAARIHASWPQVRLYLDGFHGNRKRPSKHWLGKGEFVCVAVVMPQDP